MAIRITYSTWQQWYDENPYHRPRLQHKANHKDTSRLCGKRDPAPMSERTSTYTEDDYRGRVLASYLVKRGDVG